MFRESCLTVGLAWGIALCCGGCNRRQETHLTTSGATGSAISGREIERKSAQAVRRPAHDTRSSTTEQSSESRPDEIADAPATVQSKPRTFKEALAEAARLNADAKIGTKMGETLHVGYTSYCAWSAKWSDRLSRNEFLDKRANASWLIVNMSIRNNDRKARTIPPIKLIDDAGREYDASTDGLLTEDAIGAFEELNPDVSKQGNVIFDVPKGRKYKLKLSGGYWSKDTGFINLDIR